MLSPPMPRRLQTTMRDGRIWTKFMNPLWLGRHRIFHGDDVDVKQRLQRWPSLKQPLDYSRVRRALQQWAPYAGLVYFDRLLQRLVDERSMAS
jgi:hypothetical protein